MGGTLRQRPRRRFRRPGDGVHGRMRRAGLVLGRRLTRGRDYLEHSCSLGRTLRDRWVRSLRHGNGLRRLCHLGLGQVLRGFWSGLGHRSGDGWRRGHFVNAAGRLRLPGHGGVRLHLGSPVLGRVRRGGGLRRSGWRFPWCPIQHSRCGQHDLDRHLGRCSRPRRRMCQQQSSQRCTMQRQGRRERRGLAGPGRDGQFAVKRLRQAASPRDRAPRCTRLRRPRPAPWPRAEGPPR